MKLFELKESKDDKAGKLTSIDKIRAEILSNLDKGTEVDIPKLLADNGFKPMSNEELFGHEAMDFKTMETIIKGTLGQKVIINASSSVMLHNPEFRSSCDSDYATLRDTKLEVIFSDVPTDLDDEVEVVFSKAVQGDYYDADKDDDRRVFCLSGEMNLEFVHSIYPVEPKKTKRKAH